MACMLKSLEGNILLTATLFEIHFKNVYLFLLIWLHRVLVVACDLLAVACGV